jgi:hypothetical protein
MGYSDAIYIMTSSYVQAITSKVSEDVKELEVVVGVMRDAGINPETKMEIWSIAELLEYGSEQFNTPIPARPLWRPLLEVNNHRVRTRVGQAIYWSAYHIAKQAKGKPE